jgi:hypothetical protein
MGSEGSEGSEGLRRETAGWRVWKDGRIQSDVRPNEQGGRTSNDSRLTRRPLHFGYEPGTSQGREDTILLFGASYVKQALILMEIKVYRANLDLHCETGHRMYKEGDNEFPLKTRGFYIKSVWDPWITAWDRSIKRLPQRGSPLRQGAKVFLLA